MDFVASHISFLFAASMTDNICGQIRRLREGRDAGGLTEEDPEWWFIDAAIWTLRVQALESMLDQIYEELPPAAQAHSERELDNMRLQVTLRMRTRARLLAQAARES